MFIHNYGYIFLLWITKGISTRTYLKLFGMQLSVCLGLLCIEMAKTNAPIDSAGELSVYYLTKIGTIEN